MLAGQFADLWWYPRDCNLYGWARLGCEMWNFEKGTFVGDGAKLDVELCVLGAIPSPR